MLDRATIRSHPDEVKDRLKYRLPEPDLIDRILHVDRDLRELVARLQPLQAERNRLAAQLGRRTQDPLGDAGDAGDAGAAGRVREWAAMLSDKVRALEAERRRLEQELQDLLLRVPNLPDDDVPAGPDSTANQVLCTWGTPRSFSFRPRPHWEVGAPLGLRLAEGARTSGSRFYFLQGPLADLELALALFMLETARRRGYTPVIPPHLVTREAMRDCGQLPKFEEQLYRTDRDDLFLIPTAESALAAFHRGQILEAAALPLYYAGFSPCYRREAGAASRDTRGILRVHQFHKVELFKYTLPEASEAELQTLVRDAEEVLRLLELPYRVVLLAAGDMGFAAAKTFDIEVWLPGEPDEASGRLGTYREVSSCSNCRDFQARRANVRFRRAQGAKPEYVHMLNGSGLAVGRTMVAVLENYQEADGSVTVPPALRPYLGGQARLIPGQQGQGAGPGRLSPAGPQGARHPAT